MEFLGKRCRSRLRFSIMAMVWVGLSSSGCTHAMSKKHVTSLPLVMLQEVPIPSAAKQKSRTRQTLGRDIAVSAWFLGYEGWETDALNQTLQNPNVRQVKESYFEGQFETLFLSIIAFNYESAVLKGHWVRMVPKALPPIINPVQDAQVVTPSNQEKTP